MDPDDVAHRRNQSANNAIPLQNLHGDGAPGRVGEVSREDSHRRTLSDRGRELFRVGRSGTHVRRNTGAYQPIHGNSPSPPRRPMPHSPMAFVTSPSGQRERIPDEDDEGSPSPVEDIGAFQAAIGFAGLSVNVDPDSSSEEEVDDLDRTPPHPGHRKRATRDSLPPLRTNSIEMMPVELNDGPTFLSPGVADEDDTQPLTDSPSLRRSTLATPDMKTQRNARRSFARSSALGSRFTSFDNARRSRSNARLGDDLNQLEAGSHATGVDLNRPSPTRNRSLSPSAGSPLQMTGMMLRKMSQRVVNLSNESEIVERELRHRSSIANRDRASPHEPSASATLPQQDGSSEPRTPTSEKSPSNSITPQLPALLPVVERNPLRGKSLGLIQPDSKFRLWLLDLLVHPYVEPFVLLLIVFQTVLLAVEAAQDVAVVARPKYFSHAWTNVALLVIFIIYTCEIAIRIIVSGFIFNPIEYSTIDRSIGVRQALAKKANELFALQRKPSRRGPRTDVSEPPAPDSLLHTFTAYTLDEDPGSSRQAQKKRLARRAFLRHGFNRVDFVAVVSFWISFALAVAGIEYEYHIWVFRMMSCLRIIRLLGITSGTSVILRSLKRAAPTLLNVAFLIGFFWLLFAIVGVQSFKSSLRRTCTWDGTIGDQANFSINTLPPGGSLQFCGGWLAANGSEMPWLKNDSSTWGADRHKGYLCPVGSWCIENAGVMNIPYNGTVSFDNILASMELVFVVMTSNTFSDIMYFLMDTDFMAAALFFAFGIIILTFWLISLLIAVITSTFQVIREESRSSAFTAKDDPAEDQQSKDHMDPSLGVDGKASFLQKAYKRTYWFWILVITLDLIVMSLRTATMSTRTANFISNTETIVTFVLLLDIILRFASDWRGFRCHGRNWFDLFLAIITTIMQIPVIHNSGTPYAWLTIFQIIRIYRVVLAVRITRDLILLVLRHVSGVLNLVVFVFLLTFLAAIFASQLFRGEIPVLDDYSNYDQVTFSNIFNSFLGMYQILSSENWTDILYNVTRLDKQYGTAWIGATFIILWYILANFIVLNMFIAVIQENFDVSEDQKRMQQVRMFLQQKETGSTGGGTLSLSSIFKFGQARRQDPLDFGSATIEMLLKDAVVTEFLDEQAEVNATHQHTAAAGTTPSDLTRTPSEWYGWMKQKLNNILFGREPNPFYSRLRLTRPQEELDPRTMAKEVVMAAEQRKISQRDYLRRHPTYNTTLFLFKPHNPIRVLCQRIVGPGRGERIDGVDPDTTTWYIFSVFIYLAIVGMVLLACVTTPLFQLEYFQAHQGINWFVWTDIGFAALFSVEAIIKVIADGFFWTPNAYYRSSWGFIDGVVLLTLWINIFTTLSNPGSGSRAVGAFKALRALRLLNVSDSARDTFHSVIVLGGWKVLSAAFVSLSLLIPFAIYGLNLFAGKMDWCNDWQQYDVYNLTDCVGESILSPYEWNILAPRRVAPNYLEYDFDSFGDSLFLLFQIVSQEGWIDAMWSAQSIRGVFTQPYWFAQQGNAVFFVVFNLLGAVFVLTLFVSVFMRNYTEQTGVAYLTTEQRSWLELRKLLRQVAPSKRPNRQNNRQNWQEWCYRRAITKSGRWYRAMTGILIAHLILLCLEWYPEPAAWQITRNCIFFIFVLIYIANIGIRIIGLSWARFSRSAWDVYSLISVAATFVASFLAFGLSGNSIYAQIHKLLLVSLALLLIPRNNQLDQLFKTAAASLSSIANLLATWFVLFLVFAIAFNQTFGLTRFGYNETNNINFRTVPKALILLFRMSVGEGWNQIMTDFAHVTPPYCTISDKYFEGDCGSPQWAYALFVSWNILSMYIFVNLFISLIYESFSYVYQRSSGLSIISREEIRRYKQAWTEYDPNGTGFISKEAFPRFLGELSGVFEMRIYESDFSISALVEDCRKEGRRTESMIYDEPGPAKAEIDLAKLNRRLAELPVAEIRRRRARMNIFYEEVLVSAHPDKGVSFTELLLILAHYKVINDSKSLKLEEFLRRRVRLQRVEDAVRRNIVRGFFDTLYWSRKRRRALAIKNNGRLTEVPSHAFSVPEILVHDESDDDDHSTHVDASTDPERSASKKRNVPIVSITPVDERPSPFDDPFRSDGPATDPDGVSRASSSAAYSLRRSNSIQQTPSASPIVPAFAATLSPTHQPSPSASSIQSDWHFAGPAGAAAAGTAAERTRAGSVSLAPASPPLSPGLSDEEVAAARSRANSAVSQHDMLGMFQDSAWGQSMRRSFTQRRPSADS